jgi:hypothetical protein
VIYYVRVNEDAWERVEEFRIGESRVGPSRNRKQRRGKEHRTGVGDRNK